MKRLSSFFLFIYLINFWNCSDYGSPINCNVEVDCAGECNGNSVTDICGICGGDGSTCNISYSKTIQPLMDLYCISCHGNGGGLDLTSYEKLMVGGNAGASIISGKSTESLLIKKLRGTGGGDQMPASNCCLNESIILLIEAWINEGAQDN